MAAEECPVKVWGGRGFSHHRCGRPVKRDGMCGIHAAAKERAAQRRLENDKAFERENERRAHAREMADALKALGFASTSNWGGEVIILEPEKLVQHLKAGG